MKETNEERVRFSHVTVWLFSLLTSPCFAFLNWSLFLTHFVCKHTRKIWLWQRMLDPLAPQSIWRYYKLLSVFLHWHLVKFYHCHTKVKADHFRTWIIHVFHPPLLAYQKHHLTHQFCLRLEKQTKAHHEICMQHKILGSVHFKVIRFYKWKYFSYKICLSQNLKENVCRLQPCVAMSGVWDTVLLKR